jgi:ADP-ribose pyrophosphatase YjhB (NUDIX family)
MAILADWKYCPRCQAEICGDETRVECPECGFVAYANPAPTATAVIEDDEGRVLLGLRAIEPDLDKWDLPGGFVEEGEHPLDALRRELREEASLEVDPGDFLGVWMDRYGGDAPGVSTLNMYWTARITGGELRSADDVAELRWFRVDEIPWEKLAFRVNEKVLHAWLERRGQA